MEAGERYITVMSERKHFHYRNILRSCLDIVIPLARLGLVKSHIGQVAVLGLGTSILALFELYFQTSPGLVELPPMLDHDQLDSDQEAASTPGSSRAVSQLCLARPTHGHGVGDDSINSNINNSDFKQSDRDHEHISKWNVIHNNNSSSTLSMASSRGSASSVEGATGGHGSTHVDHEAQSGFSRERSSGSFQRAASDSLF